MSGFQPVYIGGYPSGGLVTDRKPFLVPDQAWINLYNSYCWRNRCIKRLGIKLVGRLQIVLTNQALANADGTSTYTIANIFSTLSISGSTNEIAPGSFNIIVGTGGTSTTFTDQGNGTFLRTAGTTYQINTAITASFVNYVTGQFQLTFTVIPPNGTAVHATFNYYPTLPVEGICKRDIATEGIDNTIYFDTVHAYSVATNQFQQFPPATTTTWTGNQTDMFWYCNYQGSDPSIKTFFATNNNITLGAATPYDPIRYYNSIVGDWTTLQPILTQTGPTKLFQALILVPYYGRLLALNTWEGTSVAASTNFYARCRFSQLGDPTQNGSTGPYVPGSWATDVFGKGGFIDAPTNESIVSAAFFRNTLIVFFEYSTWQLRYVGEYGLPFIWERISSDFGSNETFSSIIFDKGVLTVNSRGIISASASGVQRIDEQIPETVYDFQISSSTSSTNNQNFVHGIRDFEKEIVYWNYVDANIVPVDVQTNGTIFPNSTLLYNYKNGTWAQFRDNVTCFGMAQFSSGITWDSLTTIWDSNVSWDSQDTQADTFFVVSGNQQGFVHLYEYGGDSLEFETPYPSVSEFDPSLSITAVNLSNNPVQLTINNHNLLEGEIIYVSNMAWLPAGLNPTDPGLNNQIYKITLPSTNAHNVIGLMQWNGVNYVNVTTTSTSTYLGAGVVSLLPNVNLTTKDFNPFQAKGNNLKLSYVDFLFDTNREYGINGFNIKLFTNTYVSQEQPANYLYTNTDIINASPSFTISSISKSNPCQVTSNNHSLQNGCQIWLSQVQGMIQVNNAAYTISVIDANNFTLDGIDSTGFTTYTSGGYWNLLRNPFIQYPEQGSDYQWFRFYSSNYGQYLRLQISYDDFLMNQLTTHQFGFQLHGMNFWMREAGRLIQ